MEQECWREFGRSKEHMEEGLSSIMMVLYYYIIILFIIYYFNIII